MSAVLSAGEAVVTARLRIETATAGQAEGGEIWLEAALKPEWTIADLTPWLSSGKALAISDPAGDLVGLAVVALNAPLREAAAIPFLTVRPDRRYRGLGGEAAIGIERHLRLKGFEQVFVSVPDSRGLAIYFWLRLGFRPLLLADSPGPLLWLSGESQAGIWMVRDRD